MSIFSRTRDIFAANITEMLDRSEDPAKMIRMVILEMEETLVEVRASAARCIADGKEMRRALSRLDELQRSWTEKAELALSKDREDLAKAALIERQKAADMGEGLRDEIKVIDDTLKGYEGDIAKLQNKLREARARQNAIAARFESAVTRARAREIMNGSRTEDAFSRFEILERRADFAEGRADALGMTGPKSLEEEIAELKAADMGEGLREEIKVIDDTLKGYEGDIAKLQGKLREARARQNAIAARFESAVTRARARELLNGNRTEDAFSRFEVLERRADFAEGRADALGMSGPKSLEEEIAELKAAESVDAELAAMKAALKAKGK